MQKIEKKPSFYTIPSGYPFLTSLAKGLLEETAGKAEELGQYLVFLPTRRACRELQTELLRLTDGKPLILPGIQPLGDIDPDELFFLDGSAGETIARIPPPIPRMKRLFLLSRLVSALPGYGADQIQAMKLADALGRFIDHVHAEGLDLKNLKTIVSEEFAEHWQISLDYLSVLGKAWPEILAENGFIDPADYRNRILNAASVAFESSPPSGPVIVAGSTGSLAATRNFLKTISRMIDGRVILPGLDQYCSETIWENIDELHPQYALKNLVNTLETDRSEIEIWPRLTVPEAGLSPPSLTRKIIETRQMLASCFMCPADTLAVRQEDHGYDSRISGNSLEKALEDLTYCSCMSEEEEAKVIALILRETLETPHKTAAVVTPDRKIARRIMAQCLRWGITIEDSAGCALSHTRTGQFLKTVMDCVLDRFSSLTLLALLKHEFCNPGTETETYRHVVGNLDYYLRGLRPADGIQGIRDRIREKEKDHEYDKAIFAGVYTLLDKLEEAFRPLANISGRREARFSDWISAHLEVCETLSSSYKRLWGDDEGEAAAGFFAAVSENSGLTREMDGHDYRVLLDHLMKDVVVRPKFGMHPRLKIYGQLEARLLHADVLVLAGLNEGQWPENPAADPWMSRPMRKAFGMTLQDIGIGQSAHDFVEYFCAPRVILTRSEKNEGIPTVPSRWIQRLSMTLKAFFTKDNARKEQGSEEFGLGPGFYIEYARSLDYPRSPIQAWPRPAPRPPVNKRPRRLSATKIETWMRDPYALYAEKILRLAKLDPPGKEPGALEKGVWIHDVLEWFVTAYPDQMPDNAADILLSYGWELLGDMRTDKTVAGYWWPRFENIAHWFVHNELDRRQQYRSAVIEEKGSMVLDGPAGPFELTAKADRIDRSISKGLILIDYKTGQPPSNKDVIRGIAPQLGIEALILKKGGFQKCEAGGEIESLQYWVLKGRRPAAEITEINPGKDKTLDDFVCSVEEGITNLVSVFDDPETPYLSLPDPGVEPPDEWQDYAHLARVREWKVMVGNDEG